ncbi:conserved hypothetical protein [Vibrio crassostreae]|nr:conserved hypothetical protein [Vibrio crassostreae]CAK1779909.1 conserved hypothetical protein [Vibrio crassostreae]CAK2246910.1 conserved hypothetical protein [Vibrio crassostreae]CAK2571885.1 conserved hypothetical protein [Vibrio crassostreae]CAK2593654.1 conserved hypothetical protein [Vibrio crassostreae]
MYNQLTDLDGLLLQVRSKHSQEYLREAIISYRAGAYRAAVTSTWIAICVDVIEKTKELAISGDAEAIRVEQRLNGIQSHDVRGMLDFENDILRIAQEDLGMLSLIEKMHLERIKEDRNICAHPTFSVDGTQFVPQPEMARSYIVQASKYLLNQAPVKGKVILKNIYDLITSDSFPEDKEKAFVVLSAEQYLGRVKDSVYRNLTIILFKRLFKDEETISPELMKKITSALSAIVRLNSKEYRNVCTEKLSNILAASNDDQLKRIIPFLGLKPQLWPYVEDAIKQRIEQTINVMDISSLIRYQVAHSAEQIAEINTYFQTSIDGAREPDLKKLLKESPSKLLVDKAIDAFVGSGSFASAYNNGVDILLKHSQFITDARLQQVFDGSLSNSTYKINQILNAGGMSEVFAMLYSRTKNDLVVNHANMWRDFRQQLSGRNFEYQDLDGFMEADGIIELEHPQPEAEEL